MDKEQEVLMESGKRRLMAPSKGMDRHAERGHMRVEALSRLNARQYATLCDEMGITPEDGELYKEGIAALNHEKEQNEMTELVEKQREFERTIATKIPKERYAAFLAQAAKEKINAHDLCSGTIHKRSLLFKFFPEDFAPGKPRDIRFTGQRDVGIMFREVSDYAEGKAKGRGQRSMKSV
jgi:hypothetical protein